MDWSDFVVADFQKLEREARICRKMQVHLLALELNVIYLSIDISIFVLIDGFIIFSFDFTVSTFIFNKYFISISFHIPAHENYICLLSWFLFVFPADLYLSSQLIYICLLSTQTLWGCTTGYRRRASITSSLICKPNRYSSSFLP